MISRAVTLAGEECVGCRVRNTQDFVTDTVSTVELQTSLNIIFISNVFDITAVKIKSQLWRFLKVEHPIIITA